MKRSFLILLGATLLAACSPKPEATLNGTVTGVEDGTKVYLHDNAQAKLDSTTVAGGKFRFEFPKVDYPDQNVLQFDGVRGAFQFFVEPGTIVATISVGEGATFSGTPANDALTNFNTAVADMSDYEEQLALVNQTIADNANTVFGAYLTWTTAYSLTTPEMVDSVLNIIAAAPANACTDRLKERRDVLVATAVGQPAPDFSQAQADGTPLSLSSLKGKLVLIDFWASWCGPCRAENPNVVKVYNKYHDKGFDILGVSLDDNRENWLKAIEDDGLTWNHVSDLAGWKNAVAAQYAVRSIPHTVLVGADGVIIAKNLRGEALEAKIAEILGQ
jgi:peroxiredoxin